ncbi:GbpC/Spa domain-containing protein [Parvimonas micra]|uniref:GbpC/Spa domain-containing protein n=1 Tax=Parvimonas micra TaxID=33033 RepID=UPI002B494C1D|nr:GbpC/Spa domain-containing protein [Parvimonas micra]MEB3060995.1 GbpC/Spa domain-containing protein [Parvimonas micra]MEB3067241.1 GbpC/Spa domain-containing protein [Parvimonas micra]
MKKKEIINKIISMLTIFALIIPIASQVKAADPVKGIEVNADSTELDKAVKDGKASGLDITEDSKQDKGSVNSNAEADAKLAEINADYKAQVQKIKAAKVKMDDYNAKKAKYDKEKEKYDKDLAKYNEDYAKYLKEYEEFKKQYEKEKKEMEEKIKEYKKHKDEEGYLSSPYAKTLVYDSEPDAELTLSANQGKYMSKNAVDNAFSKTKQYADKLLQLDNMSIKELDIAGSTTNKMELYGNFDDKASWKTNVSENGTVKWATVLLQKGQSVTATYTNLKKTYYNGKKISKIVFKYTVTSDSAFKNGKAWLGIFTDPTLGVFASAYTGEDEKDTSIFVKNEFTFYDQDGKEVEFQDALMSVASLNREYNSIELAKDYKAGQFVKITGSTVGEDKARNLIYATESLNFKQGEGGCKHTMYKRDSEPGSGWDTADAPNSWYGAGVVRLQGKNNQITLGAASVSKILDPPDYGITVPGKDNKDGKKPNIWYSLNGKVRAIGIPEIKAKEPNKPVKPTPPEEPQKPETKITYHHSVFYVKSQVEKKALNENNKDINNSVVKTGSVVNFELNTSDFPKGHEKIESLVFTDTLPKGYELDLDGTKAKNSDYDVEYTKETGLLKFTAKTSLLEKINNDLTKDAKVPSPKITGKVTKEGTKYENKFKVTINNVYNVESKPVKVYTPTEPKKDVFKGSDITSIDGKIVEAGQELRYEITYKNTTGTKQTVTITDKIPQYTKFVSADNDGTENGGTVKWVKEVEDGNSITVSFKVKVDDDVNGKPIDNISHVKDGFNDSDTNETHNPTPTKPKKEVFDSKNDKVSIDGNEVKAGQELLYKITYKNTTGTKQTVTITDKIPEHTTFVSADNDGTENSGTIKWVKEVENGDSITVSFKVKVNDNVNGQKILNKANVVDGNNKFDTNETTNPTSTKPKKDVFDSKDDKISIDGNEVKAGQELLYKVTYKNTTGKDQKVVIKDKIPEHTTYVKGSASNKGVYKDGEITWTKEKVADGEIFEVTFKVKVNDDVNGEKILNKANVVDGNNKFDTNETTNPTSTKPKKDVFDSQNDKISIDGNEVKAGQELLYKITYKNTTGTKQTVTITDKIPEHTTFVSADNDGTENSGTIKWVKEVENGDSVTVSFKVKVNDNVNGQKILNKANVVDGNNKFDTNETTNPTSTKPKKDVFSPSDDKVSIDGNEVKAGQELLYKVTYKNTTGKEQKVVIKDKIPEYTTYVEGSASNKGVYKDGEITWTKEKVADGETFEVTFKVKVNDNVNGEKILNKANVVEGNNNYDTNETTNPTPTKPVKDVFDSQDDIAPSQLFRDDRISIDGNEVKAGQELLYKVTYKNTTGKEQKVVIKDKIPEHTTYVEGSADNDGVYKDGEITWTKEKVADGETFEVTFKVKVNDNVNGEKILNKANVVEGNNNYDTNETTNPTSTKPKKDVFSPSDDKVSIDGNEVKAGQELLYKVTYKNTTGKEQKVVIKDKIPEHTTYVEGSADNGGVYKDGEITWTKEKVADGETFEVTFKVKVNDNVNGEKILNKANVVDGNNNYDTNETTNPTSTKPKKDVFDSQDDIAPSQLFRDDRISIDGNEVKAGQELLYKVTYKNTTGKDQKVVIKDKIPEHTTYVEGSASDDGVYKDGEITWTKEKVADGETFEVTFKVKVNDNVNGEKILNKANVVDGNNNYDTNETTNPTPTKPVKDVFSPSDDKVSIDGNEVKAGQELLYKVTYKNTTGKDQKVEIKDRIPEYTTYVESSADNGGVYKDGEITWTKEKVADGETFEVTFKVKVNNNVNGEKILNKANVVEGNNNYDTNETTNPTPTKPVKDVFDSQDNKVSIDGNEVKAGQELLYKVTYKNTTGKDQKAVIKDKIPEHTTYVEGSADNDGVYKDGEITWTKEKVADGETFEVTFKVKVNDNVNGEKILNKANVVEGNNNYDTNETTNPTSTKPKKDVFSPSDDKVSIDGNEVKAGQELLYKVTYKNTTGKDQKVVIKDKIPEHTTYVENSADNGGVYKDGEITWTKDKVADGETFEVTFKVKVNDNVNGKKILNKANVVDGNNEFDTNETTNPTPTKPKKDVFSPSDDKVSIDGNEVKAGQELLYKVTYKNTTGKDQKVVIKDKIPEHTTYVEGSADNGGVYKDGEITWTKEKVADGETFEVTFKVKVNDNVNGEKILNKANVVDGNNEFDTNETTNPTPTKPKKDVFSPSDDKVSIDGNEVKAGRELLYKVTYKNTTGKDQKVVIKDKIPEHTTYVEGSADNGGVYKDGEITWTKEKVADGETFEVTFKVKVNDNVNGEKILNKANVVEGNNNYDTNETTNPTPLKPRPIIPKTGYAVNTALYTVLLGLSTGALGAIKIRYKKKNKK